MNFTNGATLDQLTARQVKEKQVPMFPKNDMSLDYRPNALKRLERQVNGKRNNN